MHIFGREQYVGSVVGDGRRGENWGVRGVRPSRCAVGHVQRVEDAVTRTEQDAPPENKRRHPDAFACLE